MANVIIGIHGLGNKPSKELLKHWWKMAMIEGLKANNYKFVLPKFEMVYWADILHEKALSETEKDVNSPYYLDEKYVKSAKKVQQENHDIRKKFVDFIGKQLKKIFLNDDFSLNYSFITDALVSKYFRDLEIYYSEDCTNKNDQTCKARELIRKRLLDVLEKYKKDDIMLISHSMGSIIAFDVMTFLAPHIKINTFVTIGSPLGLPIVVSKIAAEQKRMLNGENHMVAPPGIVKNWYNLSDILDKVAIDYKLDDDFQANIHGIKPIDILVVNDYEINGEPNPHKSYGYLRTPEFSKILNEFILAERLSLKQKFVRKTNQIINHMKSNIKIQTDKIGSRLKL